MSCSIFPINNLAALLTLLFYKDKLMSMSIVMVVLLLVKIMLDLLCDP